MDKEHEKVEVMSEITKTKLRKVIKESRKEWIAALKKLLWAYESGVGCDICPLCDAGWRSAEKYNRHIHVKDEAGLFITSCSCCVWVYFTGQRCDDSYWDYMTKDLGHVSCHTMCWSRERPSENKEWQEHRVKQIQEWIARIEGWKP